ncbi:YjiH family protein [Bacillus carboniphilus]|uniref:YjiH family protein n=1 Tax=Bacillus carboniphilus TaxID=86663 RepID=A0ABP3FIM3_9BACI
MEQKNLEKQKINPSLKAYSIGDYLNFIIPSIIGIFLFMIPITVEDGMTIPVAWLAGWLRDSVIFNSIPYVTIPNIATLFMGIAGIGSLLAKVKKPTKPLYKILFDVHWFWVVVRLLGFVFALMTVNEWGPEAIYSGDTGALVLDLIVTLFTIFLFAGLFLPLLLDFGLLEFVGTLLIKVMRPVFKLPGRSSIDALASWVGDGTIGIVLTDKQYQDGFYTKREAAVIGTTFSVVSITFSITVLETVGLSHLFGPYYLTIVAAGFVAALIMPRIPPLSRKADTVFEGAEQRPDETIPDGTNMFKWGIAQAAHKASKTKNYKSVIQGGIKNVLDMWIGVIPVVMAFGTLALVIATYTDFFVLIGKPIEPILELMQVPEAAEAAQTVLIGFADMFLPAILAADMIESSMTLFIIASLSVTQLIYMSEVGGLLIGSKVPVNFLDLVIIFLLRTAITLPIIVLAAHIIF